MRENALTVERTVVTATAKYWYFTMKGRQSRRVKNDLGENLGMGDKLLSETTTYQRETSHVV